MSQSLASITIHVVFSTKNRRKDLDAELRPRLFAYIAEVTTKVPRPTSWAAASSTFTLF